MNWCVTVEIIEVNAGADTGCYRCSCNFDGYYFGYDRNGSVILMMVYMSIDGYSRRHPGAYLVVCPGFRYHLNQWSRRPGCHDN